MLKEVSGVQEILHSPLIYACNESNKLCVWRPEDIGCISVIKEDNLNLWITSNGYKWAIFAVEYDSAIDGIILDIVKEHYNLITNGSLLYCSTSKDSSGNSKCCFDSTSQAKNITAVYSFSRNIADSNCSNKSVSTKSIILSAVLLCLVIALYHCI